MYMYMSSTIKNRLNVHVIAYIHCTVPNINIHVHVSCIYVLCFS